MLAFVLRGFCSSCCKYRCHATAKMLLGGMLLSSHS